MEKKVPRFFSQQERKGESNETNASRLGRIPASPPSAFDWHSTAGSLSSPHLHMPSFHYPTCCFFIVIPFLLNRLVLQQLFFLSARISP